MTSKTEILQALQFTGVYPKNPINSTGSARETITWQFAGTAAPTDFDLSYTGWTSFAAAEKSAFEVVLAHIETFLNVDFVEVAGDSDPDLNVGKVTLPGPTTGTGGYSFSSIGATIVEWDAFVVYDNTLDLSLGAQTSLLLHEMGHALGLKHPFSEPALPAGEDSHKYSVMAYDANPDNGQRSDAMMLYDTYALQDIWGAAGYLTGNTSYTGSRTDTVDTIWDTGGTDTFNAATRTGAVTLDLRQGEFSTFDSYPDVVIAYGVEIENAKGGSGSDTITGNMLDNLLLGRSGNDTLDSGGGDDRIRGGNGRDELIGRDGRDRLWGQNDDDTLSGGDGRDVLKGGSGNDTLNGDGGNDRLSGNQGADRFVFALHGDRDRISDFEDDLDQIQFIGLGAVSDVLAVASEVGGAVVFDFGGGDRLTVFNTTLVEVSDDIVI